MNKGKYSKNKRNFSIEASNSYKYIDLEKKYRHFFKTSVLVILLCFFSYFCKTKNNPLVMKRIILILSALTLTCLSVKAQKALYFLKSTGQNVNVRVGPGKNYRVLDCSGAYGSDGLKAQLYKGEVVGTDGIKSNGFTHVYYMGWYNQWSEGWVSSQYLAPTAKCRACNGVGVFNRKCPDCNGEGYHACCNFTGKAHCKSCEGLGYK